MSSIVKQVTLQNIKAGNYQIGSAFLGIPKTSPHTVTLNTGDIGNPAAQVFSAPDLRKWAEEFNAMADALEGRSVV